MGGPTQRDERRDNLALFGDFDDWGPAGGRDGGVNFLRAGVRVVVIGAGVMGLGDEARLWRASSASWRKRLWCLGAAAMLVAMKKKRKETYVR
jgi:hypothetical protein